MSEAVFRRPAVANLSQVFFFTLKAPPLDLKSLDRFLFSAQVYKLKAHIVFNKIDLLNSDEQRQLESFSSIYRKIGYTTLWTSAVTGEGLAELVEHCKITFLHFPACQEQERAHYCQNLSLRKVFVPQMFQEVPEEVLTPQPMFLSSLLKKADMWQTHRVYLS